MIHALIYTEASNIQLCYKLTSILQRMAKDQTVHILQEQMNLILHLCTFKQMFAKKTKWRIIQAD